MPSRYFRWDGTKFVELVDETSSESASAAIIADTMPELRHPVTGEIYTSKNRYINDTRAMGYEIMGNERHGPQSIPDRITDAKVLDACHRAEAIQSDPAKLNARRNFEMMKRETYEKLMGNTDGSRR